MCICYHRCGLKEKVNVATKQRKILPQLTISILCKEWWLPLAVMYITAGVVTEVNHSLNHRTTVIHMEMQAEATQVVVQTGINHLSPVALRICQELDKRLIRLLWTTSKLTQLNYNLIEKEESALGDNRSLPISKMKIGTSRWTMQVDTDKQQLLVPLSTRTCNWMMAVKLCHKADLLSASQIVVALEEIILLLITANLDKECQRPLLE